MKFAFISEEKVAFPVAAASRAARPWVVSGTGRAR
jgi:hypothetical protein